MTPFLPWTATLTEGEHMLTYFFLVVAGLALFAGFLRASYTRSEIGARYQTASIARLGVKGVAALSYVLVLVNFSFAYDKTPAGWVPNDSAIYAFAPRYMEWAVTVPLLTVELLSVCVLAGAALRRTRGIAVAGSFGMIFCGFLGVFVSDSITGLIGWGLVSAAFWVATNAVLIRAVRQSLSLLTPASAAVLKNATIVLLAGWVVYPLVYLIHFVGDGGVWATVMQVALCAADVLVKVGFGGLTHRLAKLRTAEDVRAGEDVHPEAIWISSEKQSDAGQAREVYLADDQIVHRRRVRPAEATAVAAPVESQPSEFE
jgi:bacteriorhodopsin